MLEISDLESRFCFCFDSCLTSRIESRGIVHEAKLISVQFYKFEYLRNYQRVMLEIFKNDRDKMHKQYAY